MGDKEHSEQRSSMCQGRENCCLPRIAKGSQIRSDRQQVTEQGKAMVRFFNGKVIKEPERWPPRDEQEMV